MQLGSASSGVEAKQRMLAPTTLQGGRREPTACCVGGTYAELQRRYLIVVIYVCAGAADMTCFILIERSREVLARRAFSGLPAAQAPADTCDQPLQRQPDFGACYRTSLIFCPLQ